MSDVKSTPASPQSEPGVMGSLPKTRPQRPSARRNAARSKAAATPKPQANPRPKPTNPSPQPKPKPKPKAKIPKPKSEPPRAPRQGFEAESDVVPGKAVQPPGTAELAASVVELVGELAQSGLNSGGKLLKDALARLSRP